MATNRLGPAPQTQRNPIDFSVIWMEPKVFNQDINKQQASTRFLTSSPVGMMGLETTQRGTTGQMHWLWQQAASLGHHPTVSLGNLDCSMHAAQAPSPAEPRSNWATTGAEIRCTVWQGRQKAPGLPHTGFMFVLSDTPDLSKYHGAHHVVTGRLHMKLPNPDATRTSFLAWLK